MEDTRRTWPIKLTKQSIYRLTEIEVESMRHPWADTRSTEYDKTVMKSAQSVNRVLVEGVRIKKKKIIRQH